MAKYIVVLRGDGMEEMIVFPEFLKHSTMKNRMIFEDGDNSRQDKIVSAGKFKLHSESGPYCIVGSVSLAICYSKERNEIDDALAQRLFREL